ncbi:hypothetical protein [Cyclobacterium amurskyense]|uniref:hypothetical protein n=1 Tax=Cyclobacterium amurskyense TaxID=320787 RepID=UPI0030DC108D|tara:strand:- start:29 stop:568 length:540 start_codon:yes stop_codon:yes gene_type:complete
MTSSLPKTQEIITYSRIYGEPPPPAMDIIRGMCKKTIIYEIVHINHWLNPKSKVYFDNSLNTQLEILAYLTRKVETNVLFDHYMSPLDQITKNKNKIIITIFNRINCLFALELITNSEDFEDILDFEMNTIEKWKSLIDFLLAINWELIEWENQGLEKINHSSIESLNPVMLPINELMI